MDEIFVDTTPSGPDGTANAPAEVADSDVKRAPYTIMVSAKVFSLLCLFKNRREN